MRTNLATCLTIAALTSGCATGYGTLAAAGAGAVFGTIGTVVSSARGEHVDGSLVAEDAAAGAVLGVIGAAVAAAIARSEGRKQAAEDATKRSNDERIRALEEALKKRGAEARAQ